MMYFHKVLRWKIKTRSAILKHHQRWSALRVINIGRWHAPSEINYELGMVPWSFDNLAIRGAYLRDFSPRYFGTGFPLNHLRSHLITLFSQVLSRFYQRRTLGHELWAGTYRYSHPWWFQRHACSTSEYFDTGHADHRFAREAFPSLWKLLLKTTLFLSPFFKSHRQTKAN